MPEGPEIRRAADSIAAAIQGHVAERVFFALEPLKPFEQRLTGQRVVAIETAGKAMLTRFENGLNIYSHNQLYGRWYIMPRDRLPATGRRLRLRIDTARHSALLYSASSIEVLRDAELGSHPFLCKLGPDVLDEQTDVGCVLERLTDPRFSRRQLGGFLTDQGFVAGLGNYLRCELLFVAALAPEARPCDLPPPRLEALAEAILALPRQSYRSGGITNDRQRAEALMAAGAGFEEARFFVFRRAGKPCYRCGGTIQKSVRGGQACYHCPGCQTTA